MLSLNGRGANGKIFRHIKVYTMLHRGQPVLQLGNLNAVYDKFIGK